MLSPDYLKNCAGAVLGVYDGLETAIAQDVAKSIAKNGSLIATTEWQIQRMQSCGKLLNDVIKDVSSYSTLGQKEIEKAFQEAAVVSMENDAKPLIEAGMLTKSDITLSAEMTQLLEATIRNTNGYLGNLTRTTGSTTYGLYMEQTNIAFSKVASGATSYEKAVADAVKGAAKEGSTVLYTTKNGVSHSQLDVAVRRSVMTGINQTCGKITEMWAEDMGVEYYEVDAHLGARPSHQDWEGQVYKINGSDDQYENFYDATGYGDGDGLCGYNCRHSFYPYWPGISKRAYTSSELKDIHDTSYEYDGKTLSEYQCSQMQRAYERNIRDCKRVLASYDAAMTSTNDSSLKEELRSRFNSESVTLKSMEKEMKDFCSQTNRSVDSSRTQVVAYKDDNGNIVNFGHSTSMKAVWAAR